MTESVLIVAQALKGSLSAGTVARALERAARAAGLRPTVVLGSDGGDGLLDALSPALVRRTNHAATGPLGDPLTAPLGWLDAETAVLESRLVCGLSLLAPAFRDPLRTTTRGVGELVDAAGAAGARRVYIGLGGSATMDGGLGMARAWGWRPRDPEGRDLAEGGGALEQLHALDPGHRRSLRLVGLCDVRNPLLGPRGARVYAPQKGASPADVERLERGLAKLVATAAAHGEEGLAERPGAGAAGGLGFGILLFGGGSLESGASWVLDRTVFPAALPAARLVVTAEGGFDRTSLEGKLAGEVIRRARAAGVPVLLLAPSVEDVPPDVEVETGGGIWDAEELEQRARRRMGEVGGEG